VHRLIKFHLLEKFIHIVSGASIVHLGVSIQVHPLLEDSLPIDHHLFLLPLDQLVLIDASAFFLWHLWK